MECTINSKYPLFSEYSTKKLVNDRHHRVIVEHSLTPFSTLTFQRNQQMKCFYFSFSNKFTTSKNIKTPNIDKEYTTLEK